MNSKQVPLWLFDEVQHVIDEIDILIRADNQQITSETLHNWRGLLCALLYIDERPLTQKEMDFALDFKPEQSNK